MNILTSSHEHLKFDGLPKPKFRTDKYLSRTKGKSEQDLIEVGFYACKCGERIVSDIPFQVLCCQTCGAEIPRQNLMQDVKREDFNRLAGDFINSKEIK
jgi:hypothetical protein